jgi:hypothetical protein
MTWTKLRETAYATISSISIRIVSEVHTKTASRLYLRVARHVAAAVAGGCHQGKG